MQSSLFAQEEPKKLSLGKQQALASNNSYKAVVISTAANSEQGYGLFYELLRNSIKC
jgi:hypothetical protein